jgi:hypothetical protein
MYRKTMLQVYINPHRRDLLEGAEVSGQAGAPGDRP